MNRYSIEALNNDNKILDFTSGNDASIIIKDLKDKNKGISKFRIHDNYIGFTSINNSENVMLYGE